MNEDKKLNANVDFYSASLYYMLGLPPDLFTPIVAVSRMACKRFSTPTFAANDQLGRPRLSTKNRLKSSPQRSSSTPATTWQRWLRRASLVIW